MVEAVNNLSPAVLLAGGVLVATVVWLVKEVWE